MSDQVAEHSIADISRACGLNILDCSLDSTRTIRTLLDGRPSKFKRLINRFKKDPEQDDQIFKLHFHLAIAYLAVLVVELQTSEYFRPYAEAIVHDVVEFFYRFIEEASENLSGGLVVGDEFIKDPDERNVILTELRRNMPTVFGEHSGLPRIGLTAIADMLLEKRLNEYREMWIDDMMRMHQDGFMALMPTRVYQHWSGDNPRSWQSVLFSVQLTAGLMPFSATVSKVLAMTRVKR
jgi:hypothetical protein